MTELINPFAEPFIHDATTDFNDVNDVKGDHATCSFQRTDSPEMWNRLNG
jgi:hypothetical protein